MSWERSVPARPARLVAGLAAALCLTCLPLSAASGSRAPAPPLPVVPPGPEPVASRVTDVVVFPQHAQISRGVRVEAAAGENCVVLGDLVPKLNPHTLRASAGDGALEGSCLADSLRLRSGSSMRTGRHESWTV